MFSPRMKSTSSRGLKGVSVDHTDKNIIIPYLDVNKKNLLNRGESLFSGMKSLLVYKKCVELFFFFFFHYIFYSFILFYY